MILVRVSALIFAAPFFGIRGIPNQLKIGFSVFLSLMIASSMDYYDLGYSTVAGFTVMVVKEAVTGLLLGLSANLAMQTVQFAGTIMDVDLGFSMVQLFDPSTNQEASAFGSFYSYLVMLVMICMDMHYFIIQALVDSFYLIPIGAQGLHDSVFYDSVVTFATQYFIIGFRIILPIFASSLFLNIILGILARTAPQMNMFVVGMQLKVLIGLAVLLVALTCLPGVTDMVYTTMKDFMKMMSRSIAPG